MTEKEWLKRLEKEIIENEHLKKNRGSQIGKWTIRKIGGNMYWQNREERERNRIK